MSSRRKKANEVSIQNHKHCIICGGVVSADKEPPVCAGYCEEELAKREKRSRTFNLIWMIMIFGLMALVMISFLGPALLGG